MDLSRARFLADPQAQRAHAFDEAGRVMRHDFWVPDMAEVDWDGVLDTYRPLLARIRTADDFADLVWEVFGSLGTSHRLRTGRRRQWPSLRHTADGLPRCRPGAGRGRQLAGGAVPARRVFRPARPVHPLSGRARPCRPVRRCSRWTGSRVDPASRAGPAAGGRRAQTGGAHRVRDGDSAAG